ncbi:MAG: GAF domain-containing protein [candidate division Zixibacteria bacterium]|nr:GAF domain-containing protein [candidate division Zixibacteria bacterium]
MESVKNELNSDLDIIWKIGYYNSRNPFFVYSEGQLFHYNDEFAEFSKRILGFEDITRGFQWVFGEIQAQSHDNLKDGIVLRSNAGNDERVFQVHRFTIDNGTGTEINICQISGEPPGLAGYNRNRFYNITSVISQLGRKLSNSYRLDETFKIILIGATAGDALGFNRAFLMLSGEGDAFKGEIAIGPSDGAEAAAIWSEIDGQQKSLDELIDNYNNATSSYDVKVNELVRRIKLHKRNMPIPLRQILNSHKPGVLFKSENPADNYLFDILGVESLAVAPLTVEGNITGLLLADNFITGRKITSADLEILAIFANHAGVALERSRLYEKLGEKIDQLAKANNTIRVSQQKLVESEKLNAIGKMASQVAHEIRNPLSVVGGFARNIRRKINNEHQFSDSLDIIIKEVDRIENVLENFTSITRAAPESKSVIDFSELTMDVFQLLNDGFQNNQSTFRFAEFQENIKVFGSEKQLRNVLLVAGRQFSRHGGAGSDIDIKLVIDRDEVELSFTYSGDHEGNIDAKKIFENIFNTSPLKRETDLAIANEIINQHFGKLGVQRGKNQPLSIVINLPYCKE